MLQHLCSSLAWSWGSPLVRIRQAAQSSPARRGCAPSTRRGARPGRGIDSWSGERWNLELFEKPFCPKIIDVKRFVAIMYHLALSSFRSWFAYKVSSSIDLCMQFFFAMCFIFILKKKKEGRENSWVIIENHYKIADQMIFFYNSRRPVPTCFLRDCKWVWLSDLIFLGNWLIEINQLFHTQSQFKKMSRFSFMPANEVCVFWLENWWISCKWFVAVPLSCDAIRSLSLCLCMFVENELSPLGQLLKCTLCDRDAG